MDISPYGQFVDLPGLGPRQAFGAAEKYRFTNQKIKYIGFTLEVFLFSHLLTFENKKLNVVYSTMYSQLKVKTYL